MSEDTGAESGTRFYKHVRRPAYYKHVRRLADAEGRLLRLETYFKVGLGVAVIFGLSGAWGAQMLYKAHNKFMQINDEIASKSIELNQLKRVIISEIQNAESTTTQSQIAKIQGASKNLQQQSEAANRRPRKVCGISGGENFSYMIVVPDTFTMEDCRRAGAWSEAKAVVHFCMDDHSITRSGNPVSCSWQ
ncbi:hypothetical protein J8J14_24660 [Roseomonas sp. SSH11]|uniref:Uncharacterized protein n=1 Tax=Pararoseomonas baculiformis TaxID=2820812 RepID=A0ABS4ALY7_9PROT|nr:hypothetical protein [Pararoseomonas baculiformis]MBP0447919.1 hypothetical protein [Pararoseomonas baculiformis]